MRKVWQFLPTFFFGDAIGNDCLAISRFLTRKGVENKIGATTIHPKMDPYAVAFEEAKKQISPEDVIIYHLSTGDAMNDWFSDLPNKKAVIYHNITPAEFFQGYSDIHVKVTEEGRLQAKRMASRVDLSIADSEYNAREMEEMGFPKASVVPILLPFEDYRKTPDEKKVEEMSDGRTNILFVGRIAPNKKQEDIISVFAEYVKNFDPDARLILAGSCGGLEKYQERLESFTAKLGISDQVIFTGHISFAEILAYYKTASAFVIMSEHEGFCVPVVEAYLFDLPVLACDYGAIGETMGDAGILLSAQKEPARAASLLHEMLKDKAWQEENKARIKKALERFETEKVEETFWEAIKPLVSEPETT
ncbi:MAG: glycosyltransferase family 4 protein [Clostridiales bacterium]|nr:glycosyltransferase family 4 protein [Clostridiales bacterium]